MDTRLDILKKGLESLDLNLSEVQFQQFLDYYDLLIEKNKVMNLTGITDFSEVVTKHFLDSLSLIRIIDFRKMLNVDLKTRINLEINRNLESNKDSELSISSNDVKSFPNKKNINRTYRLLDLGTGAGFPGIPLKIVFPELEIVLLDSVNKKLVFLQEVIDTLGLKKIEVVHGRAEDLARDSAYRESFDFCVSRAVALLSSLSEYCIPFVKKNGVFISYKSGKFEEELKKAEKAIGILGGKLEKVEMFQLPDTDMKRSLILVRKVKNTKKLYPRKAGLPSKQPIGEKPVTVQRENVE
ncbi:ribosomal RNA small subunit methyltransferase G [Clostridia bacterium]|nr:ribosomal RNA small subunit methyltransferase G [Clostridia bacterium]